jgi:phosphoribosylaminoimidazole-succinocarboxamide synthase
MTTDLHHADALHHADVVRSRVTGDASPSPSPRGKHSLVTSDSSVLSTDLPFPRRSGKVRDVYTIDDRTLLIVATDRISAFDVVMPNGVPGKGRLLTAMSNFWFGKFADQFANHLIATDVRGFPAALKPFAQMLEGRSVLAKRTNVIPIECVARGYLAGSGWKEYQQTQSVCGVRLPPGLRQCDRLPAPIFTPATKADEGHDQNISYEQAVETIGEPTARHLRDATLKLYTLAAEYAATRGIVIADTKFEFGRLPDGSIILIDEVLTPDSSRFWPAREYAPGRDQASFDKQFMRNWLERQPWDKTPPAPMLPDDVVHGTQARYAEALRMLTA